MFEIFQQSKKKTLPAYSAPLAIAGQGSSPTLLPESASLAGVWPPALLGWIRSIVG